MAIALQGVGGGGWDRCGWLGVASRSKNGALRDVSQKEMGGNIWREVMTEMMDETEKGKDKRD